MAGVIPDTGSISLGGTDERSIVALRNIKNTVGNTNNMLQLSAVRDWSDEFLGSGKPAGFPSGDEVSLGDWRGASIFGAAINIKTETDTTYDDSADGSIRCRGKSGSGLYEFQLVQDTASSSANYVDAVRGIDIDADTPGADGNEITLSSGGSTASNMDDDLSVIDIISLEAVANGTAYNITITGNSTLTVTELLDASANSASDYAITAGASFVLENSQSVVIAGGTASAKSIFSGSKNVIKLITAQRIGASNTTDVTVTGNSTSTVQALFTAAGISVNIDEGANEVLATSGNFGSVTANDLVLTGGSAGTTFQGAVNTWNAADGGSNQATVNSGGSVTMGTGESIILTGGSAGYDVTKTTSGTDAATFTGLGGAASGSVNYYYILTITDRDTLDSFSVKILVGLGATGTNAVYQNPAPHTQIGTADSDPDSIYLDTFNVFTGDEDGNTGGVAYGN